MEFLTGFLLCALAKIITAADSQMCSSRVNSQIFNSACKIEFSCPKGRTLVWLGPSSCCMGKERKISVGVERGARAPDKPGLSVFSDSSRAAAQTNGLLLLLLLLQIIKRSLLFLWTVCAAVLRTCACRNCLQRASCTDHHCIAQPQRCGQVGADICCIPEKERGYFLGLLKNLG